MTEYPVDLDERRGAAALTAAIIRRRRHQGSQGELITLQRHRLELETLPHAVPAQTWPEAAAMARYVIELFAATPEAQDPRRKALIAHALDDLTRMCARAQDA
jgi:hypothetical protein